MKNAPCHTGRVELSGSPCHCAGTGHPTPCITCMASGRGVCSCLNGRRVWGRLQRQTRVGPGLARWEVPGHHLIRELLLPRVEPHSANGRSCLECPLLPWWVELFPTTEPQKGTLGLPWAVPHLSLPPLPRHLSDSLPALTRRPPCGVVTWACLACVCR